MTPERLGNLERWGQLFGIAEIAELCADLRRLRSQIERWADYCTNFLTRPRGPSGNYVQLPAAEIEAFRNELRAAYPATEPEKGGES